MRAFNMWTKKEISYGCEVHIYKCIDRLGNDWADTGEIGIFEEVTESGLINFYMKSDMKPRQCMPEGLGLTLQEI